MAKVSVVLLNYNGRHYLEKFLPPLIQHSAEADIVVIDNGSSDDSIGYITRSHPEITIVPLERNFGFTGGYNRGLQQIDADYFLLLNTDVEVTPNWLHPLIRLLDEHQEIGACGSTLMAYHQRDTFEYAGAAGGFIDRLGYAFCRGRMFDTMETNEGQYDDTRAVFWVSGACIMVRANLFHDAGGFDEEFFAHMEEIDLCWRLNRMGYKVYISGESKVFHVGGGTLSAINPKKTFFNFRNGLSMIYKNSSFAALCWKLPVRIALDWVAALKFLAEGSALHARAVFSAHFDFARRLAQLKRSKSLFRNKAIRKTDETNIYPGAVIVDYFLAGKKRFRDLSF